MDNDNKLPNPSTGGPVMDVQAPQPTNPTVNPVSTEPMVGGPATDSSSSTSSSASPVTSPAPMSEALSGTEPVAETSAPVAPVEPFGSSGSTEGPSEGPSEGASESSPDSSFSPAGPGHTQEASPTPAGVTPPAAQPTKKHHGAPIAAVIVAIIIALALIGVAVFAYTKSKNKTTPTAPVTPAASQTSNSVSTQDVDNSSNNIDSNLKKIDEAKDFPVTDLSDSSLSLQ